MAIWEQRGGSCSRRGGTCGVPCSPVTLILSGERTKRRTSCHSRRSFDVLLRHSRTHTPLQRSRGLFLFIMRIGFFVARLVDKPHSRKGEVVDKVAKLQLSKDM